MSTTGSTINAPPSGTEKPLDRDRVLEILAGVLQVPLGLLPRTVHRAQFKLIGREHDNVRGAEVLWRSAASLGVGLAMFFGMIVAGIVLLALWAHTWPPIVRLLGRAGLIAEDSGWLNSVPAAAGMQMMFAFAFAYVSGLFVKAPYESIGQPFRVLRGILWLREVIARITGLLFLLGLGMLPLSSLLMFLPVVMPQEAVLTDTITPARTGWQRFLRRAFAIVVGFCVLAALLTFSIQVVAAFGLESKTYASIAKGILGASLVDRLPKALVDGWPFVLLLMYAIDFVLLYFIGKVPLSYNLRNLRVRWVTTMMTGIAFTVVVALLILMSSFVDSVNRLTANSGVPGNVFVMSEGSTDELFSKLNYGDVAKLELETATTDARGQPLKKPISVKSEPGKGASPRQRWISKETYFVISQEVKSPDGNTTSRFIQVRGVEDAEVAGKVHDIKLDKGEWFGREGAISVSAEGTAVPCVLGQGAAAAFGADIGKEKLNVGDVFKIGDLDMVVVGIMASAGRTFDSETWATNKRLADTFGKQAYTTVVLRVNDDNPETAKQSAELFAAHLTANFTSPRVRAVSEVRYYEDLANSNQQLMFLVTGVAIIMALGGTIGVMLVMFAAIAQRIKDIGVMRVVGYKRWQILVSFMLESLAIAIIGGLVGVLLVLLVDGAASVIQGGLTITSNVSAGQGGGKTVVTRLLFGTDAFAGGMLFTMIMGRLGGLLPSVGAMRLGILESLR